MSLRLIRTLLTACLCWVVIARPAPAYYHFTHYASVDGPYTPILEKFDLDALLDRTVYFHVASASPRLPANDSYEGLVSQIRQALAVWNSVPTSSLRVAYAGTSDAPSLSKSPGGEIIFAELPPGVIGFGGPVTPLGDPKSGFVPIIRSQVILSNDLTQGSRPRPTFSEVFFTSLVHEIGHALGLQHTLTGSVMSTDVTRAATRALPLGADDIAGLSVLYPSPDFSQLNGALAGRVTTQTGAAVHMASVVAVGPNEQVVSALTAPDGAYRIDGLAPGRYRVYVHPLPPSTQEGLGPANIRLPTLLNNQQLSPAGPFKTVFFGDTNRPGESPLVETQAGVVRAGIDFRVEPRGDLPLYNVTTFSFPGNGAAGVHPAFLDAVTEPAGFILATGPGLAEKAASISVETLASGIEVRTPRLYEPDPRFIRVDFSFSPLTSLDPAHLIFHLPDDIYVLPSGVRLTARPAPIVHWVALGEDEEERPVWFVRGANFDPRSAVYFDGWPAEVLSFRSEPEQIGVNPPVGVPGRPAVVTVYNPDGQSSAFTLPDGNVMFRFPDRPGGGVSISPAEAEVDSDVVIEISGVNATFVAGDTTIGFGSSDVVIRELYILSPNRAMAVATVRSNAAPGTYKLTVTTGLEVLEAPGGFRVLESGGPGGEPRVRFQSLVNSATMQPNLSPGVLASLYGRNLAVEDAGQVQVTFNGQAATLVSISAGQINLQIPAGLTPGPVVMEVFNGETKSKPLLAYLNAVSPGIFAVTHADGSLVAADNPVVPNETLVLVATGLGLGSLKSGIDGLRISSGQKLVAPTKVEPVTSLPGVYVIYFQAPAPGSSSSRVFLWAAGERSNALALPLGTVAATSADSR